MANSKETRGVRKQKTIRVYRKEDLEGLPRVELNRIGLEIGLTLNEQMEDSTFLASFIVGQREFLLNLAPEDRCRIKNPKALPEEVLQTWRKDGYSDEADKEPEYRLERDAKGRYQKEKADAGSASEAPFMKAMSKAEKSTAEGNQTVWFRVSAGTSKSEKAPVFAAVNSESVLIHRNTWVKLKKKFLPCFEDAVITLVEVGKDGEKELRHAPRFNVSVRSIEEGIPQERSGGAGGF